MVTDLVWEFWLHLSQQMTSFLRPFFIFDPLRGED